MIIHIILKAFELGVRESLYLQFILKYNYEYHFDCHYRGKCTDELQGI